MAKEYDPEPGGVVKLKITRKRQAGETFYVARCKEHGWETTAESESQAALAFVNDHMPRHPGCTIKRV